MSSDASYSSPDTGDTGPVPGLASDAPMANRGQQRKGRHHLLSIILSLVVTPVGLALVAVGTDRWIAFDPGRNEAVNGVVPWLGGGAAVLLLAALFSRISGAGPLLAGLLWGLGPAGWLLLDQASFVDFVQSLPVGPEQPQDNVVVWGPAAFTCAAGLLVGAGLAGRWKQVQSGL